MIFRYISRYSCCAFENACKRKGLITARNFHGGSRLKTAHKSKETDLIRQLGAQIKMTGPITVADYMREVLTNPTAGYYMNKDVFGTKGDFTTSPEISQMFGELLAVWCVHEWMESGSPSKVQLVEMGPGRGTLAHDMLRVFSQFPGIKDAVTLHLVEVSPTLSAIQYEKLTGVKAPGTSMNDTESTYYQQCKSLFGPQVLWHNNISQVPDGFSFYIAQEFFDALPIHKFQYQDGKWYEVLVDVDNRSESAHHLRYILSSNTPGTKLFLKQVPPGGKRDHVEVAPEGGVIIQQLAERIKQSGGAALVVDYGHVGDKGDTFRGFRNHQLHDPLSEPGTADLTSDVDFSYLAKFAKQSVDVYGPITQERFLNNMGIGHRLQALMANVSEEQRAILISGYDMLTNPAQMGQRFKVLALLSQKDNTGYIPAGFKPPS